MYLVALNWRRSPPGGLTFYCRCVLSDKFKGASRNNKAMILGQMLHKIFQATVFKCQKMALRPEALCELVTEEVKSTLTSLESLDDL